MKKITHYIFNLNSFSLFAALIVWVFIISTLRYGISCDEGFYLMGYQHNQALGNFISDYASMVRAVTPVAWEENIMTYRVERLLMMFLALSLFAFSLLRWLRQRYDFSMNRVMFYSLVFLTGGLSYTFASPTISYDSIQTGVYLLAFSFLFLSFTCGRKIYVSLFLLLSGQAALIGVFNYFPSGIFLIGTLLVFIFIENREKRIRKALILIAGIALGMVLYHFFVRNVLDYLQVAFTGIIRAITEKSESRHDSGALLTSFFTYVGWFLLYVPAIGLGAWLVKKIRLPHRMQLLLFASLCAFFLIIRSVYSVYAPIFFFPVAWLMVGWSAEQKQIDSQLLRKNDWMLIALLILLPFVAVFGTNQSLFAKALIFMPFWLIVYFVFYTKTQDKRLKMSANALIIVLFLAGYVYLGNFARYHYYYTPRSSRFPLENIVRQQCVTVSKYQQAYFRDVADTLKAHGASKDDRYLAFGENQLTVFLMGGFVSGALPYHWFQYEKFPPERPRFFILFQKEEAEVIQHLETSGWRFPADYQRIEIRAMSENMDQKALKTVIYALNSGEE